jgi:adenosine deaminase
MNSMNDGDRVFLRKLCAGMAPPEKARWRRVFDAVASMPKADLHCHLAGSMRPSTLKDLARTVPALDWSYCDAGFGRPVARLISEGTMGEVTRLLEYRKSRGSLSDYMLAYSLPKTVLATEQALERVLFEVCEDAWLEGVRYLEIRFNPRMLTGSIKIRPYIRALARGLDSARERYPDLEAVLLLSLVKDYDSAVVEDIVRETLEENARGAVGGRVAGVDSAGNEIGFSAARHARAFEMARGAGLAVVCHAGEAFDAVEDGIAMIEDAIALLGARRIGHGLAAGLGAAGLVGTADARGGRYTAARVKKIEERQRALRKMLREENIPVEVCPSSNLHTGNLGSLAEHPIRVFLAEGVPVAICTDNRWISHTKLSWEVVRTARALGLELPQVEALVRAPFEYRLARLVRG